MRYKVLIVDDEEPARELLKSYVLKLGDFDLIGLADSALMAKEIIHDQQVDILLSDIQMDDLTGIDLLKILKDPPVTILTTAYSEYALEGYELDVVDYLVKPISFQKFCRAIDKARELISYRKQHTQTESKGAASNELQDYFFVKTNKKIVKVKYGEVLFVESFGEYVKIHTSDDILLALKTMSYMEDMLPANVFFRIHRSHIINFSHIKEVEGNQVVLADHRLTVSKRSREAFFGLLKEKGIV